MQYRKTADGKFEPMERKCVDTGMGVERTITVLQGKKSVYETELFTPIIAKIEELSGKSYGGTESDDDRSVRIISDHVRTASFILGDDAAVSPSNVGAGYILRRLIRRALLHGRKLGMDKAFMAELSSVVIDIYREFYPELEDRRESIQKELVMEEEKFLKTLQHGQHEFEKMLPNLLKGAKRIIPGRLAFKLYDTHGFPVELTQELASEHDLAVDMEGFQEAFRKHQEKSKMDSNATFKGGLADHGEATTALHTATHLLHQALRMVLGDHVGQKGSNITAERLRFDFSHPEKMTPEQIQKVEDIVNQAIKADHHVSYTTMTLAEARDSGAIALFGDKYEEVVKVYSIGDFSKEVCGGPHVEHTAQLGTFKIKKEQSSSQGVRRIKAVLER
jgi:alanyl-tRNA synthetase